MKFTPTSVGSDGSGYYQGEDGKFYYGNLLRRNYVVSTEKAPAPQASNSTDYYDSVPSELPKVSLDAGDGLVIFAGTIAWALNMAVLSAALVYMVLLIPFATVYFAVVSSWPEYLGLLIDDLRRGVFDLVVILVIAAIAFILIYFILCARKVLTQKKMMAKRMFIATVIVITAIHTLFSIFTRGFGIGAIFSAFFRALNLAALPTVGIAFLEHLVTKEQRNDQRWFLTRLAQCVTPVFPKGAKGLIILGVVTCVVSLLLTMSELMRTFGLGLIPLGIILIAMGLLDQADKAKAQNMFGA